MEGINKYIEELKFEFPTFKLICKGNHRSVINLIVLIIYHILIYKLFYYFY